MDEEKMTENKFSVQIKKGVFHNEKQN